jgi:hypothetical protein
VSTGYKIIEQDRLHFITLQVVEWVDVFTRKAYRDIIIKNLDYCQNQFWTHENHAELTYSNDFIEQKILYIHNNPVIAGIVSKAEEYLYSSAVNYADEEGLLKVKKAFIRWKTYN